MQVMTRCDAILPNGSCLERHMNMPKTGNDKDTLKESWWNVVELFKGRPMLQSQSASNEPCI